MKRLLVCAALASAACGGKATNVNNAKALAASSYAHAKAIEFLDEAPASIAGFGFIDFGKPIGAWLSDYVNVFPHAQPTLNDIRAAIARRFGLTIESANSIGIVVLAKSQVVFLVPATGQLNSQFRPWSEVANAFEVGDDLILLQAGKYWAWGERDAIKAYAAKRAHEASVVQSRGEFVKWALAQPSGGVFFAIDTKAARALASERATSGEPAAAATAAPLQDKDAFVSFACSSEACGMRAQGLAGSKGDFKQEADKLVAQARAALNQLPNTPPGRLARLYSETALRNLKIEATENALAIDFGFRSLQWPERTATPAISQRLAAPQEFALLQVDLGAPLVESLLTFVDFMATPLDRTAFKKELFALIPNNLPINATSATISVGANGTVVFSLPNSTTTPLNPGTASPAPFIATRTTPWGMAIGVADQLRKAEAPKAPFDARLEATRNIWLRGAFDVTRADQAVATVIGPWLRSAYFELNGEQVLFTATAAPGKGKAISEMIDKILAEISVSFKDAYDKRAEGSMAQEIEAISNYHGLQLIKASLLPAITGDEIRIEFKITPAQQNMFRRMMPVSMATGVLAAVAIPAFTSYLNASKAAAQPLQGPSAIAAPPASLGNSAAGGLVGGSLADAPSTTEKMPAPKSAESGKAKAKAKPKAKPQPDSKR